MAEAVIDALPHGAVLLDADCRILHINAQFLHFIGVADAYWRRLEPFAVLAARLADAGEPMLTGLIAKSADGTSGLSIAPGDTYRCGAANGQETDAVLGVVEGGHYLLSFRDSGERAKLAGALRDAERQMDNITGNLPGAVFRRIMRADGTIEYPFISAGIEDILGVSAKIFTAGEQLISDYFEAEENEPAFSRLAIARRDLTSDDREYAVRTKDGQEKWIRVITKPFPMRDGDVAWDGIILDVTSRVRINEQIARMSALMDSVIDQLPFAISVKDVETNEYILFNKAAEELLEMPREYALSHTPYTLFTPQEADRRREQDMEVAASGQVTQLSEVTIRTPSGREALVKTTKLPVLGGKHGLPHIMTIMQDVTVLRAAEEALEESRQRIQEMAESASDWFWETDAEFRFKSITAGASAADKIDATKLVGQSVIDLVRAQAFRVTSRHQGVITGKEAKRAPFRDVICNLKAQNGQEMTVRVNGRPTFDEDNAFAGYRGTVTDITAQIVAEARAARAQRQLIDALEGSSDGIALFDSEQRLVIYNQKFSSYWDGASADLIKLGVRYDWLMRSAITQANPNLSADAIEKRLADHLQRNSMTDPQTERLLADGRWIRISKWPTSEGGIGVIFSDITAAKEREIQLRDSEQAALIAKKTAEDANHAKSEFLAKMSHELRTPLNAVIGFAEIMSDELFGPLGNQSYREYVRDIHSSGTHLLALINDILDMSKVESGTIELYETEVSVAGVIAESVQLVRDQLTKGLLDVRLDVQTNLAPLWADERKLRQILLNLLSNAIKFTPENGTLCVSASVPPNGDLVMAVSDTGIGIDPKDIEVVLTPFGQVENTLNRRHDGTGLGLPLCRALAELHGGRLDLESEVGKGTRVTLHLPRERLLTDARQK